MPLSPKDLIEELQAVESDGTFFRNRQEINSKVRYARWDGQSDDGRKHQKNLGVEPFPWEGSSDVRVRLVDSIINREKSILKSAFKNAKLRIKGTELTDWRKASKYTKLIEWEVQSQMSPRAQHEITLAADWRQEKGSYGFRIDWHQEVGESEETITWQEIQEASLEVPEAEQLLLLIPDEALDEESAQILAQLNTQLSQTQAIKAVKDLRENGIARYSVPYFKTNRPRWTALRIFRDIYFPTYVDDIQRSPWIAERKYYTEHEIIEKKNEGWSQSFIDEVLKHKGEVSLDHWSTQDRNKFGRQLSYEETVEDQEDLYEIYHVYMKYNAPRSGAIGVYTMDMSYFVPDKQAKKTELLDYKHGLYPFVVGLREYTERGIIQSRGIGEYLQTHQQEYKTQRDDSSNRASLTIIPPMEVPASRAGSPIILGPGAKIPVRRQGELQFMQLPNEIQNTQLIIQNVMDEVNRSFGMNPEDPNGNLVYQQVLIDDWLSEVRQIYEHTWSLMQQFMPEIDVNLVMGGELERFQFSREEIQGKFDLSVQFDARDLDQEALEKKLNIITNVILPIDTEGSVSRTGVVRRLMEYIDPIGAEEIISSPQQIQARELEDEQDALAKIGAGVEPQLNPEGKNAQIRLQIIQDTIQSNPNNAQRYQQDEIYRGMIDARIAMFQQTLQQQQNAQTGRVGSQPFLSQIQSTI